MCKEDNFKSPAQDYKTKLNYCMELIDKLSDNTE